MKMLPVAKKALVESAKAFCFGFIVNYTGHTVSVKFGYISRYFWYTLPPSPSRFSWYILKVTGKFLRKSRPLRNGF